MWEAVWEAEMGGRSGRLNWEAELGGHGRPCEAELGGHAKSN